MEASSSDRPPSVQWWSNRQDICPAANHCLHEVQGLLEEWYDTVYFPLLFHFLQWLIVLKPCSLL